MCVGFCPLRRRHCSGLAGQHGSDMAHDSNNAELAMVNMAAAWLRHGSDMAARWLRHGRNFAPLCLTLFCFAWLWFVLHYAALLCRVLSCFALPCLALFCLSSYCLVPFRFALCCPALQGFALPGFALLCLALPNLTSYSWKIPILASLFSSFHVGAYLCTVVCVCVLSLPVFALLLPCLCHAFATSLPGCFRALSTAVLVARALLFVLLCFARTCLSLGFAFRRGEVGCAEVGEVTCAEVR